MVDLRCRDRVFPNVQAVLFDKDGTLADSLDFLRRLAQKRARLVDAQVPGVGEPLLLALGVQAGRLDRVGLMAAGSRRDNEIAAAAYIAETGRSWSEALAIAQAAFTEADHSLQRRADTCPLFPGSRERLAHLAAANLKLGLLSADTTANVEAFATDHDLRPYLQLLQGTDPQGPAKPEPACFLQACAALGVAPAATLMVGDTALDFDMARQAGAAGVVGIAWGDGATPAQPGADVVITDLRELVLDTAALAEA